MGSSSKRRQTMAKMDRERTLKERRARKQEKREARRLAGAVPEEGATPIVEEREAEAE
jgi:hypothetical protein